MELYGIESPYSGFISILAKISKNKQPVTQMNDSAIRILYSTVRGLGFLTRLPLDKKWFENNSQISADAYAFPFAGCIIGFIAAVVLLVAAILGFSPLAAASFAVLVLVILTGALHEDGLSDVADAFWALKTSEERLAIMKNSQIGVFGGLALVFAISLRIILLADIMTGSGLWAAFFILIAVEAASRGVMVWFWCSLPIAKGNGTAATVGEPDKQAGFFAAIVSLVIFAVPVIPAKGFLGFIIAVCFIILCVYAFSRLCRNKISGYTGDTIGAMQQISTIALLASLAAHF